MACQQCVWPELLSTPHRPLLLTTSSMTLQSQRFHNHKKPKQESTHPEFPGPAWETTDWGPKTGNSQIKGKCNYLSWDLNQIETWGWRMCEKGWTLHRRTGVIRVGAWRERTIRHINISGNYSTECMVIWMNYRWTTVRVLFHSGIWCQEGRMVTKKMSRMERWWWKWVEWRDDENESNGEMVVKVSRMERWWWNGAPPLLLLSSSLATEG